MNARYIILLALFFLPLTEVMSQSKLEAGGDKYFEAQAFHQAKNEYLKALEKEPGDMGITFKLAESYRLVFDYKSALKKYKVVVDKAAKNYPMALYHYASMLKMVGKYEQAIESFDLFLDKGVPGSKRKMMMEKASVDRAGCELAIEENKKPQPEFEFNKLPAPVNTDKGEYSIAIVPNSQAILIASERGDGGNSSEVLTTSQYWFEHENNVWSEKEVLK